MKKLLASFGFLAVGLVASTEAANAVVYCTHIGYPARCVARPGVILLPRPVVAPVVVAPVVRAPVVVAPVRRPVVVVR